MPVSNLADLISSIHTSLTAIGKAAPPQVEPQAPAVNPKRSVTPDFIICLDDGKKFKSLKRHIAQLGMTPAEYRTKWNLPADYPMVAPNYAAQRSELAKASGLGRKAAPVKKAAAKRKPR